MPSKKTSLLWNTPKEKLEQAVKESNFYREVGEKLDIVIHAGVYKTLKNVLKYHKIDYTHIQNNKIPKNKGNFDLSKFENHLTENSKISRSKLKNILIDKGLLEYKCNDCGLGNVWNNKKISLHIDHKNGINNDNTLNNLRFLCPNCHSQTDTYCAKNFRKSIDKCVHCGKYVEAGYLRCADCKHIPTEKDIQSKIEQRKVKDRPDLAQLEKEVLELGKEGTGRKYGVTGNTIKKWIKQYKSQ